MTYIRATRLTGEIWTASRKPQEMSSFVEDRISKLYKHNAAETVQYTNQQFARVYPKVSLSLSHTYTHVLSQPPLTLCQGTRVDSSNYDPIDAWNLGCQMVALVRRLTPPLPHLSLPSCQNHQTSSEPMWINTAKFDDNGGCGIVLKPPIMTETQRFDPVTNPTFYAQYLLPPRPLLSHCQKESQLSDSQTHYQNPRWSLPTETPKEQEQREESEEVHREKEVVSALCECEGLWLGVRHARIQRQVDRWPESAHCA